jgi:ATP-dependent Lhr-like helicase
MAAIMSGGAIPDLGDFRVVLEPTETFVGTLNEDFAIESVPGEVFQLGNASYLITKVESGAGVVRVVDAKGQPPTLPFWLGEAPGRTDELSAEVAMLRADTAGLDAIPGLPEPAARQITEYIEASKAVLGVVPTQETLVLERFFDEGGGMQLVLHAPFGTRINRAWGLALRKRFCRSFNFELQAAATDDAIVISLGAHHSFALEDVFHYLHPDQAEELLVQAMLDSPIFTSRWRWNVTRALAILRMRGGTKVPTQIQRMEAEDLVAAVFPDQLACPENLVGDRAIPDHPLVQQTIHDCLTEAMDFAGLKRVLQAMRAQQLTLVARDTTEPSPLCHEILNARPYAFLDDAPLEERRTRAVMTRRGLDVKTADEFGKLDAAAIARVKEEAWPDARTADELHDALMVAGSLPIADGGLRIADWQGLFRDLVAQGRATTLSQPGMWVAAERLPMIQAAYPGASWEPAIQAPERDRAKAWAREDALKELVRGRLEISGPVTVDGLADELGVTTGDVDIALAGLEREGFVLRGRFTPEETRLEWCERRLLSRVHRYTLDRLRREIEPVNAAEFMRFLFRWQRVAPESRADGPEGLSAVLDLLDGFELPAGAWESEVLPARVNRYDPLWLDGLCLSGEMAWGRIGLRIADSGLRNRKSGPIRTTPIALFRRERADVWRGLAGIPDATSLPLSHAASEVLRVLDQRGASFFGDLVNATGILRTEVEKGLAELVAWGLVTADSFSGLRALLVPSDRRRPIGPFVRRRGRGPVAPFGVENAGRWSHVNARTASSRSVEQNRQPTASSGGVNQDEVLVEALAWQLLRRWGVVFRKVVERENLRAPWRDVLRVLRRLEARGEVRGGRFVGGFSGEQYALPEAIGLLRQVRRDGERGELVAVSAADPLNLVGAIVPGEPVPGFAANRVLYRDGIAVAVKEGEGRDVRVLVEASAEEATQLEAALIRKQSAPLVRAYLGRRR